MVKNRKSTTLLTDSSTSSPGSSSNSAHKKKKTWSANKVKIRELQKLVESKNEAIAQMTAAHNQTIASKDQIIASKDQLIAEKDKLIQIQDQLSTELKVELKDRIRTLSTELAFKEGFLNNRGVIEQFEYRYATENERYANPTRFQLWCKILQKADCADLKSFIERRAGYNNVNAASSAIVHAYDLLSRQVHEKVTRKEIVIADDLLTREQAIILSLLAFKLNINFFSRWIDLRTIEEYFRPERRSQLRSL